MAVTSAYIPGLPVITAPDSDSATAALLRVLRSLSSSPSTGEPKLNILCWAERDNRLSPGDNRHEQTAGMAFRILVIPRKAHRPSCYYAPEGQAVRISPASVDLGGVFIVPVEDDFRRAGAEVLREIIRETVDTSWQPVIDVGLLTAPEIRARINEKEEVFRLKGKQVEWNGELRDRLEFHPDGGFTLHKVKIGINFHWEREEDQTFPGGLTILPAQEGLVAINNVLIEDYLLSVISSEMKQGTPRRNSSRPMPSSPARGCWQGPPSEAGRRTIQVRKATRMAASSAGTTGRTTPSSTYARTTTARDTRDCTGPATPTSARR